MKKNKKTFKVIRTYKENTKGTLLTTDNIWEIFETLEKNIRTGDVKGGEYIIRIEKTTPTMCSHEYKGE